MKLNHSDVHCQAHAIPGLKFESQSLTSFAGLVVFQKLFGFLGLKARLACCFDRRKAGKAFGMHTIFLHLIVHILLGFRQLRESQYYRHDPLVQRILGLKQLPSVATVSRTLKEADGQDVSHVRRLLGEMVSERLQGLALARVTMDFDGSVQSTGRFAEGTAVGFNKKKKGARSYYPLFCTIAQTGQVLDVLHRPGNVHDSNGAEAFILACIQAVREVLPGAVIEVRMDGAFFSDKIVSALDAENVEFTISVPFERFARLKAMIEGRKRWRRLGHGVCYFETPWKPESWEARFRFLFVRSRVKKQRKGPVQLDLFVPHERGYEFKVIVTNKTLSAKKVAAFQDGRGSQEGIFGELKSHCQMDYVPTRRLAGNQLYLLAGLFAHNLSRELQIETSPRSRHTTAKRAALWVFEKLDTLRATLIRRAGRLTRPRGKLTLTISANRPTQTQLLQSLAALQGTR